MAVGSHFGGVCVTLRACLAKAELGASIAHDKQIEFDLWPGSGRAQRRVSGEPVVRIGGRSRGTVMLRVWNSINIAS